MQAATLLGVTPAPRALTTLTTRKGREVQTPYTDAEALAALAALPRLSEFGEDLLVGSRSRRGLSPEQWIWVHILAVDGNAPRPKADLGDLSGIFGLFEAAASHLKRPRIVLSLDHRTVVLARCGERSQYSGAVNVTDRGPYESRVWFGRIEADGFVKGRNCDDELLGFLAAFAADPAGVAARHGALTGRCCFCDLELTDPKSVEVGYGPVCSRHYGLPWGNRPAPAVH